MAKKISIITSFILLAVLIGLIIVAATIKKDFSYDFETPDYIVLKDDRMFDKESEKTQKVMELLQNNSKESFLTYLFSKKDGKAPSIEKLRSASSSIYQSEVKNMDGVYIEIGYNTEKTLKLNGATYKDPTNSSIESVTFKKLLINLEETNGKTRLSIYVLNDAVNKKCNYVISQYGNYSDLYDYVSDSVA